MSVMLQPTSHVQLQIQFHCLTRPSPLELALEEWGQNWSYHRIAVAVRMGAVNLREVGTFEAFVSDGSATNRLTVAFSDLKEFDSKATLNIKKLSEKTGLSQKLAPPDANL